jgi:hypothetical protein
MPNTFGGTWNRPGQGRGKDRQRANSRKQLQDWASYDSQPQTSYSGCLLIALTLCAAIAAALGIALT